MKKIIIISLLFLPLLAYSQRPGKLPYQTVRQTYRGDTLERTIGDTVKYRTNAAAYKFDKILVVRDSTLLELIHEHGGGGGVTPLWYDSSNVIKPLNNNYTIELTSTSLLKAKLFLDNYGVLGLHVKNSGESSNGAVFENIAYGGKGARFNNTISGGIAGYFSNTVSGGIAGYFSNQSGTAIEISSNSTGKSIVNTYGGNTTFLLEPVGNVKATKYYVLSLNTAPSSATDTGTAGEIRVTATHIYVCTATNTWVRTALTTW